MKTRCSALNAAPGITLYHTGPALDHGPLPSLFYFALSGPDSLCLDPFNQPVQFLQGKMIRIFSMTLPGHENGLPAADAMKIWASDLSQGRDLISDFLDSAQIALEFAIREQFVNPAHLAAAGLSRGGFIALHLAALDARFRCIVGFSPMTRLAKIKEFAHLQHDEAICRFDTHRCAASLADRYIKLYVGNQDTRIGTTDCFEFAMSAASQKKRGISHVELSIYPSIGRDGHGTPPEIFKQGADWLIEKMEPARL